MVKAAFKIFMAVFLLVVVIPFSAHCETKSWTNESLTSLAHGTDYQWKVDQNEWSIPAGEYIVSAYLDIKNLNNWQEPEDEYMNIYLLNNPYK